MFAFMVFLKRYTLLSEQENTRLKETFNSLSAKDQADVLRQAKSKKNASIISALIISLIFIAVGIFTLCLSAPAVFPILLFVLTIPFVYQLYCAITWNNREQFEYLRLVDSNWVNSLLNN